jgi:hypothetical protein
MTTGDFPAAHSADTTWFAVDRDGHIAVFDSGEPGAVPEDVVDGSQELWGELERLVPLGAARYLLPSPAFIGEEIHDTYERVSGVPAIFLHRGGSAAAEEALRTGRAVRVEGPGCEAIRVEELDPELRRRLHQDFACLGCHHPPDEPFAALGLYEYRHVYFVAAPYRLGAAPTRPLSASDLPARARADLPVFDGRFAETRLLQPVEHWPSQVWGGAWLQSDRPAIRPAPGQEAGFTRDWDPEGACPGLVIDPTPFPPPSDAGLPWRRRK